MRVEQLARFVREEVRETFEERDSHRSFSRGLWRKMGEQGLFGHTIATEYGGSGEGPERLAESVITFCREGMDLGLTLSWIVHLALCSKSIEGYGSAGQKGELLPPLIRGEMVGCMAASEPETGAHPGGMKTRAEPTGEGYRIDGSKIFITNGPVADILVILAVTGRQDDRQEITAFILRSGVEGMAVDPMDTGFVLTSPHGEVGLSSAVVGRDAVLGDIGGGHDPLSKSAFRRERALVICALVGLCEAIAGVVRDQLLESGGQESMSARETSSWIHHMAALSAFEVTAKHIASMAFGEGAATPELLDQMIYIGMSLGKWGSWVEEFIASRELEVGSPLNLMLRDMQLSQVGFGLLLKMGRRRFLNP